MKMQNNKIIEHAQLLANRMNADKDRPLLISQLDTHGFVASRKFPHTIIEVVEFETGEIQRMIYQGELFQKTVIVAKSEDNVCLAR